VSLTRQYLSGTRKHSCCLHSAMLRALVTATACIAAHCVAQNSCRQSDTPPPPTHTHRHRCCQFAADLHPSQWTAVCKQYCGATRGELRASVLLARGGYSTLVCHVLDSSIPPSFLHTLAPFFRLLGLFHISADFAPPLTASVKVTVSFSGE
jgi:hypothetical protein